MAETIKQVKAYNVYDSSGTLVTGSPFSSYERAYFKDEEINYNTAFLAHKALFIDSSTDSSTKRVTFKKDSIELSIENFTYDEVIDAYNKATNVEISSDLSATEKVQLDQEINTVWHFTFPTVAGNEYKYNKLNTEWELVPST